MGEPKSALAWHGSTLLYRTCAIVARGTGGGPVVVVRAPGQALPAIPDRALVVEDEHPDRGPLQGLLAGLEALAINPHRDTAPTDAFVAATDLPFLHPQFVAAACRAARTSGSVIPRIEGRDQLLAAVYSTALTTLIRELLESGERRLGLLAERAEIYRLEELPHPESVRNINTRADYLAAVAAPLPEITIERDDGPPITVRAATLGAALAGADFTRAKIADNWVTSNPLEPLADRENVRLQ